MIGHVVVGGESESDSGIQGVVELWNSTFPRGRAPPPPPPQKKTKKKLKTHHTKNETHKPKKKKMDGNPPE